MERHSRAYFLANIFRRLKCLMVILSLICMISLILQNEQPQIFVLEPGFPTIRFAQSSGTYSPVVKSKVSPLFASTVPWPSTQAWESRNMETDTKRSLRYPHCNQLISNGNRDLQIHQNALKFMADHFPLSRSDFDYIRMTRDCESFVQDRGYIMDSTDREKDFPIAFSLVFFKDLEQVERLLRAVYRPHNLYCLHLDEKSAPSTRRALKGIASCLPNVFIASRSVNVMWGTFSVLEPELICMQDLRANKTWKYFINLTGQEFPLKTNLQLVEILKALNGSNDVDCTTNSEYSDRWYNNFPAPHNIQPKKGNLHVTASRAFVDYLMQSRIARDFLRWVKFTVYPDETFFSTLNHSPHLRVPGSYLGPPDTDAALKPFLSRFTNWGAQWKDGKGRLNFNWPCHGKRVRCVCVFGVGDLPLLTARKELFANKFHLDFEPLVLDCLEEWLWNMTMDEYSGRLLFDPSFYKSLDMVANHVP